MVTFVETKPPQLDAVTVAVVGGPCQRIFTVFIPCPEMIEPLFAGVTIHCTGVGPVTVKLVTASTQTVAGGAGVNTGGPYLFTTSV